MTKRKPVDEMRWAIDFGNEGSLWVLNRGDTEESAKRSAMPYGERAVVIRVRVTEIVKAKKKRSKK